MTVPVRLTADLCARAVIAAAGVYGVCPIEAMSLRARGSQRMIGAAASALARGLSRPVAATERMLGLNGKVVGVARAESTAVWLAAEAAALRAVEFAGWRPGNCPAAPVTTEMASNPSSEPLRGPPSPARGEGARTLAAGTVRRAVLAVLGEDPSTGPELMDLVGVGEGQIRSALSGLVDEGRVVGTKLTAEGWAARTWSLRA